MTKYFVGIKKEIYCQYEVEADNEQQAETIAWSKFYSGEEAKEFTNVVIDHLDTEEGEAVA